MASSDRILALAGIAASRNESGTFATSEVVGMISALRLPPHTNVSATLGRLRDRDLLMRPDTQSWALTPEGEQEYSRITVEIDPEQLAAEISVAGSELGARRHTLIPPLLAPAEVETGVQRMLDSGNFDYNIMLITRFPRSDDDDKIAALIPRLRSATSAHGMKLHIASDGNNQDTLWSNVVTYMWGCRYGIVLIDDAGLNPNVLIETGGMLMTGRRCAIFRDRGAPSMPTDLVGHIYKPVDFGDPEAIEEAVHDWLVDDLKLAACPMCARAA